jgi:hypothetical protein
MVDKETTRVRSPRKGARRKHALDATTVVMERNTTESASVNQEGESKKEEKAMPERDTNSGMLTDVANSIVSTMRDIAARSIDANVSFAKQMLDYQVQSTSWAKDTPMGAMFKSQYELNEGLIELLAGVARSLWRIEKPKSES